MHKYRAVPTTLDGRRFASKKEARRYAELLLLQKAGLVRNLECQVSFPLKVNGVLVGTYVADFEYVENARQVVEDVKGMKTPVYNLKRKLMKAVYDIDIVET
jgi:hypothetical protein